MIRKTVSGLVLLLFVMSIVPLALAEEERTVQDVVKEGRNALREQVSERKQELREELKEKRNEVREEVREKSREKIEQGLARGGVSEERREKVLEKVEILKSEQKKLREEYKEQRSKLKELQKSIRGCRENCSEQKGELRLRAKEHVLKMIELMEKPLEKMAAQGMDVTELQEKLAAEKEKVEQLDETVSTAEYRKIVKELRQTWVEIKKEMRLKLVAQTRAKLDNVVEKRDDALAAMDKRIETVKAAGKDSSTLEQIRQKYSEELQLLKEQHDAMEQLWQEGVLEKSLDQYKDAQEKVKESLQKTKETLREFLAVEKELTTPEG